MTPYYQQNGITIYNADCMDVLPTIDPTDVDLVLTDPPYGIEWKAPRVKGKTRGARSHHRIHGDDQPFDPAHLLRFARVAIWGADHFSTALPVGSWLAWDKTGGGKVKGALNLGTAEMMWHNLGGPSHSFPYLWLGYQRDGEHQTSFHPTQKPVALMTWIIDRWTEPGDLILDPYMGSGPIAEVCYKLGRRYIGIEIVEEYCQIAVNRLAQQVLPLQAEEASNPERD